ncbi:MAG: hypothetical protein H7258_13670 [Ferruginibacter sp.]|nr:hypothetical protein [Ferruginibacter sp.]
MKKSKDNLAESKETERENKSRSKAKIGSAANKTNEFPEEFEEDRSMNIRMKPQPLTEPVKKSTAKKKIK